MRTTPQQKNRHWLLLAVCLLASMGLLRLPERLNSSLRSLVIDSATPVQWSKTQLAQFFDQNFSDEHDLLRTQLEQMIAQRDAALAQARVQQLAFAEYREQTVRQDELGPSPFQQTTAESLVVSDVVTASVLGREERRLLDEGLLLVRETDQPIETGSLVLQAAETPEVILDRGARDGLETEFPIYAGRTVIGRLSDVGEWISRVQLVTDPGYRGHAQILRSTEQGFQYGPEGIIEGTGENLLRLRYIGKTESVSVGDAVYTGSRSHALPAPMFYGTIVKAELNEADREWSIWIEPAAKPDSLRTVQILRHSVNPQRVLGN